MTITLRHTIVAVGLAAFGCVLPSAGAAQSGPVRLSRVEFSHATRGQRLVLGYALTAANRGGFVGIRFDFDRDDGGGRESTVAATPKEPDGSASLIELKPGKEASGVLSLPLEPGLYRAFRFRLLDAPDGKAILSEKVVYDSASDAKVRKVALGVRIRGAAGDEAKANGAPTMLTPAQPALEPNANGTWSATATVEVRVPAGTPAEASYRIVASGNMGVAEQWARGDVAAFDGRGGRRAAVFTFRDLRPGLYSAQFDLYDAAGKRLQNLQGVFDFEAGGPGWVRKAPLDRLPPRLRVRGRRWQTVSGAPFDFYAASPTARTVVALVRGGNYGNAVCWTATPELNSPAYFAKLRAMGCRFMRVSFNQERYPDDDRYRRAVDQIVQNILSAGMYPIVNPQGLPKGADRGEQVRRGLRVVEAMAREYRGMPVWISVCNEPHEFGNWTDWKPVAVRYARAIRAIDPDAFVIVPFEFLSKDGRAAARDPITEVAVDLYDGHAYLQPEEMRAQLGPAVQAGLPVLLGEYGGGAGYLARMHAAMESMPGLMAISPWAFTKLGMDAMPLVEDGTGPMLRFTPSGAVVAAAFDAWEHGHSVRGDR